MTEVAVADDLPLNMFCNLARPLRRPRPMQVVTCHSSSVHVYGTEASFSLHEAKSNIVLTSTEPAFGKPDTWLPDCRVMLAGKGLTMANKAPVRGSLAPAPGI